MLTEAKKEDERKRATLFSFYERTDVCLQSMDGKVHALLEQNIGNLKEKIASHKQNLLKREYIVLVAGLLYVNNLTAIALKFLVSPTSSTNRLEFKTNKEKKASFSYYANPASTNKKASDRAIK